MSALSVYLHIPFCAQKCVYCDFASYPRREADWHRYADTVVREMDAHRELLKDRTVTTVFFGGGTPSLIPAKMLTGLMDALRERCVLAPDAEITLEANPGTLTSEKLKAYREAGFNRISLGAQSTDDGLLRALGRIHTAKDIFSAVDLARKAGFDNLSLDLMYGLPGQTLRQWQKTLLDVTALEPEHISAYSLIVEEGTPLYDRAEAGLVEIPDDDATLSFQRYAVQMLAERGYERYEISNYAHPGYACRHNTVYWERGDYLGLGCAAHSLIDGVRFENPRSLEEYLSGTRMLGRTELTKADIREETLMLATRMAKGVRLSDLDRPLTGVDWLEKNGYIAVENGFLRLTERGMEVQNAVLIRLMEGFDDE